MRITHAPSLYLHCWGLNPHTPPLSYSLFLPPLSLTHTRTHTFSSLTVLAASSRAVYLLKMSSPEEGVGLSEGSDIFINCEYQLACQIGLKGMMAR